MSTKKKSAPKFNRRTLPEHTRLKLWIKAAGRCEFHGCNKPVWRMLMFLGKCIGDTIPADLYQSHRNIKDTSQTWSWQTEEQETHTSYIVNPLKFRENGDKIAVISAKSR